MLTWCCILQGPRRAVPHGQRHVAAAARLHGAGRRRHAAAQDECIRTTSTCGVGMLDAGAAVARGVVRGRPHRSQPGGRHQHRRRRWRSTARWRCQAPAAQRSAGSAITSYAWSLPDGDALVSLSATSGSSVTLTLRVRGTTHVMLTITDAAGVTSHITTGVTVTAKASTSGGGGSSGGWRQAVPRTRPG